MPETYPPESVLMEVEYDASLQPDAGSAERMLELNLERSRDFVPDSGSLAMGFEDQ